MKDMTLRTGMGLMLGLFALLVLAVGAGGWLALKEASRSFDTLNRLNVTQIGAAEQAYGALLQTRLQLNTYQTLYNRLKVKPAKLAWAQAEETFGQAQQALQRLDPHQVSPAAAPLVTATQAAFTALIEQGILPTFDALKRWDMSDYTRADAEAHRLLAELDAALAQLTDHAGASGLQAAADMARNVAWMRIGMPCAFLLVALLMGLSYLATRRTLFAPLARAQRHFETIAGGDLTAAIAHRRNDEIGRLFDSLAAMQQALCAMVLTTRQGSDGIHAHAQPLTEASAELAARAEQQAAAVQQTTASMEEMTAAVKHNAENAEQGRRLSNHAAQVVMRSGQQTHEAIATMVDANAHSRQAFEIIAMIDEIAFQTNILALNASVEAARAGDKGRGFAVVASEVRSLSQRSAEAARSIRTLIEETHARVSDGTRLIEAAGKTIDEVEKTSGQVTALLEAIAHACREQHDGIAQINGAIVQIDTATQHNAAMAQQTVAVVHAIRQQADRLAAHVGQFNVHGDATAMHAAAGDEHDAQAAAPGSDAHRRVALPA